MKKTQIIIASIIIILFAGCKTGPHVIMTTNDNGNKTSIEYYGKIAFTEDNKGIKSMAKHSRIIFKKNGTQIVAERDINGITYKVNGDTKVDSLSSDQKQMISDIILKVHQV